MSKVYESCPLLESEQYLLRLVEQSDYRALLKVYGDKLALPYFNSDNCHGDIFYYPTESRMKEAIAFWLREYAQGYYVRFSIVDKAAALPIGTVELFRRTAGDFFNQCGILRLDVGSENEREDVLRGILSLILESAFDLFECEWIATKAPVYAVARIQVLKSAGFEKTEEKLMGGDSTAYGDYWILKK